MGLREWETIWTTTMRIGVSESELWQWLGVCGHTLDAMLARVLEQLYCSTSFTCPLHRQGWCALHPEHVRAVADRESGVVIVDEMTMEGER